MRLEERREDDEREETEDDGRNRREHLDDRFRHLAHGKRKNVAQAERGEDPERHGDDRGAERDERAPDEDRERAELGCLPRRIPVRAREELLHAFDPEEGKRVAHDEIEDEEEGDDGARRDRDEQRMTEKGAEAPEAPGALAYEKLFAHQYFVTGTKPISSMICWPFCVR